ncbi:MHC class I polypeptide-related sequence B [Ictidomys tridecemlineatus]
MKLKPVMLLLAAAAICASLGTAAGECAHCGSSEREMLERSRASSGFQGVWSPLGGLWGVKEAFGAGGGLFPTKPQLRFSGRIPHHLPQGPTVFTITLVRSQGGSVQSSADGYWDHQLFLHYDSDSKESPKPQGPWAEKPLGTERWNTEIQELKEHIKKAKATLAEINAQQEQRGGSHSLQEIWGCKIEEDNHTRSFWMIYYDGEPFLSYHPETRSLRVEPSSAQTLVMEVKNSWDADGIQSKDIWAHVQGELCGKLRTYQVSWKGSSLSPRASAQGTLLLPTVNVTCGETSEDTINVTCWACGFYPQSISVTWLQDGELLSQDTQDSVDVFPYGNGTYQTWLSTRIPQGQEQRLSCHVVHIGKNTTVPVSCGKLGDPSRGSQPRWPVTMVVRRKKP